jgi:hypothetical protein
MEEFERDLALLEAVLNEGLDERLRERLGRLKSGLIQLRRDNIIKINHSVMELVCARFLLLKGYEVDVERQLAGSLVCDLYATREDEIMIVEIETGFVPPENALDPLAYYEARIASKVSRYCAHSNRFGLGTPPHHIMNIPKVFLIHPEERRVESMAELKEKCDRYYKNPPIELNSIRSGFLNAVYVINVDESRVIEFDPPDYSAKYPFLI